MKSVLAFLVLTLGLILGVNGIVEYFDSKTPPVTTRKYTFLVQCSFAGGIAYEHIHTHSTGTIRSNMALTIYEINTGAHKYYYPADKCLVVETLEAE